MLVERRVRAARYWPILGGTPVVNGAQIDAPKPVSELRACSSAAGIGDFSFDGSSDEEPG